jgi:hypothetical protein
MIEGSLANEPSSWEQDTVYEGQLLSSSAGFKGSEVRQRTVSMTAQPQETRLPAPRQTGSDIVVGKYEKS